MILLEKVKCINKRSADFIKFIFFLLINTKLYSFVISSLLVISLKLII